MRARDIGRILKILKAETRLWKVPAVGVVERDHGRDPFLILVSCLISLRTKDAVTAAASKRLFKLARTPRELAALPARAIERAIYPACFYRNKARVLQGVSRGILDRYAGQVPDTIEGLTTFKGVGRKTANLVVTLGFRKPGICVDIHVHRILNRLGYVRTKVPDETEAVLRRILPRRHWLTLNDILVTYGQNRCVPVSPWCSRCRVERFCARRGVPRSR